MPQSKSTTPTIRRIRVILVAHFYVDTEFPVGSRLGRHNATGDAWVGGGGVEGERAAVHTHLSAVGAFVFLLGGIGQLIGDVVGIGAFEVLEHLFHIVDQRVGSIGDVLEHVDAVVYDDAVVGCVVGAVQRIVCTRGVDDAVVEG